MIDLTLDRIVPWLNALPPEAVWALLLIACFTTVVAMAAAFGQAGLYAYIVVAILGANVQVLKPVQFSVFADPVALGTILFASTYLATDVLAEHYGRAAARRGVWLGFSTFLFWTVMMALTLGFRPITPEQAGDGLAWAVGVQDAMMLLFQPAPAFFVAGMAAYLVSQFHDIWLYRLLRRMTGGKRLWLRNNASTAISALIDNTIFSVLAWIVFSPEPLPFATVVGTYILGTYVLRLAVAVLDTPFVYAARAVLGPPPAGGTGEDPERRPASAVA